MGKMYIKNINFLFVVFVIIWSILIVFIVRDEDMTFSPKVLEQSRITVNIKSDVLAEALTARASDWCSYDNALFGDFTIQLKSGSSKFAGIFQTDSIAAKTAFNYPHLFQYIEIDDNISFKMKKYVFEGYVVVPAWLVEALLKNDVLVLDNDHHNL